ncbi:hypothetical protein A9Q96_16530 [Rhodobacterales bacterium 52_120_T64]|nr:hypothetical protein A9Q96_16530 [Rhodobacterales bacterium 52_120_T64]
MKLFNGGNFALGLACGVITLLLFLITFSTIDISLFKDRAILGAIIGGSLSGAVALISVILSIVNANKHHVQKKVLQEEANLLLTFTKLTTILDSLTKAYRHQLSSEERSSIHLRGEPPVKNPLSGIREIIRFSDSEKVLPLQIKCAELFNNIAEAERISESLFFLQEEYDKVFSEFQQKIMSQKTVSIEGRRISGEVEISKFDLLRVRDVDGHLHRLLMESLPTIKSSHSHIISLLKERYGRNIVFEENQTIRGGVYSYD